MLDGMRDGLACTGGAAPSSDATRTGGFRLGLGGSFAVCFAGARSCSAALDRKLLHSRDTILAGFWRPRLVSGLRLDGMREGMACASGAAPSSDASRTGIFKFGFGSVAACFADALPRAATPVRKPLDSRATMLAGLSRPRLVPVTRGLADGA